MVRQEGGRVLKYILKRLILIPLTLFAIISINFIILNAA
ncbi:putative membrane protein, partial [Chlamydia psittaci 84-8471/1]